MRRFWIVLVLIATTLIFAQIKNPDTIITLTIGEPDTLNSHFAYDTASGEVLGQIYECLIEYVGSSVVEMAPRLATAVPSLENGLIKDGGKTYIFPIRKNVKFHNGAVLTPEDVDYSFEKGFVLRPIWWTHVDALGGSV